MSVILFLVLIVQKQFDVTDIIESKFEMVDGIFLSALEVSESQSPCVIVLHLHANSFTNIIYTSYARSLASNGAVVCLLNLRGNGSSEGSKGRVDYVGQLESDVHEVLKQLRDKYPNARVVLSGHSGGSAICLRYFNQFDTKDISGLILLAPIIQPHPEASRYDMPGSALLKFFKPRQYEKKELPEDKRGQLPKVFVFRIFLAWLIPLLRNITTVEFPKNGEVHKGRTFNFSYKTMKNYGIENYKKTFSDIQIPVFTSIGTDDDVTLPKFIDDLCFKYFGNQPNSEWHLIEGSNHSNIVRKSQKKVISWLHNIT